jgi:hypothetical protein
MTSRLIGRRPAASRAGVRCRTVAGALCLLAGLAGCRQLANPLADVELQQSLVDLQDLLTEMRDQTAQLQWQLDSLRDVVARQDSTLRVVANLVGAPLPPSPRR